MNILEKYSLLLTFIASIIVVGIPYMGLPYEKLSLPNALWGVGLIIPVLGAAFSRFLSKTTFRDSMLSVAAVFPAIVLVRVIYDTAATENSHNLWPFEILIAAVLGLFVGAIGGACGNLLARIWPYDDEGKNDNDSL